MSALGIARSRAPKSPGEPFHVGEAGEPAVIEGVKGEWRVDPARLAQPFAGRAALLSPFDRLLHDRKRMDDVFEFDYILEMYKPAAARIPGATTPCPSCTATGWSGSWTPGPTARKACSALAAIHEDAPFGTAMAAAVEHEIRDLARGSTWSRSCPTDPCVSGAASSQDVGFSAARRRCRRMVKKMMVIATVVTRPEMTKDASGYSPSARPIW